MTAAGKEIDVETITVSTLARNIVCTVLNPTSNKDNDR